MTFSVLWTALPVGYDPDDPNFLRVCAVASPRVENGATTLNGHPLANWPKIVRELGELQVEIIDPDGSTSTVAAVTLPSAPDAPNPDTELWKRIFPTSRTVDRFRKGMRQIRIDAQASYVAAAEGLDTLIRAAVHSDGIAAASNGRSSDGRETGGRALVDETMDVLAFLSTGAEPSSGIRRPGFAPAVSFDAVRGTESADIGQWSGTAINRAIADLTARGDIAMATALPIAAYARALRGRRAGSDRNAGPTTGGSRIGPSGPLRDVLPISAGEYHQIVGLLIGHPALARRLGLRIDLRIPAFSGTRTIRVVTAQGAPLNGLVTRLQPYSRVQANPAARQFTMTTLPDSEIAEGQIDLGLGAVPGRYLTTTLDVAGLALQAETQAVARVARASSPIGPRATPVSAEPTDDLPVRRDTGITLAGRTRPELVAVPAVQRAVRLEAPDATTETINGSAVLFADDVKRGYRFDVSTDGGPFRSLMRRAVRYTVGAPSAGTAPITFTADDEGCVDAVQASAQDDEEGVPRLVAGEEIVSWDGWALAAPRPGRVVSAFPDEREQTAQLGEAIVPGVEVRSKVSAVPGTVPPLRYGHRYAFAARMVDVGGNSLPAGSANRTRAGAALPYLRLEASRPPTLVPLQRYTDGESLERLVVRSNGSGTPIGGRSQRHLAPPKAAQRQAELHGMFDEAFGPNATQQQRATALAIAKREAGTLLDPVVVAADGSTVKAIGIGVITNDPSNTPRVTLPLPRGQGLPNGAYVIHDTPALLLPYLPDPIVDGVAIIGIPGRVSPLVLRYTGDEWPDLRPGRIVVLPGTDPDAPLTAVLTTEGGRSVVQLIAPPGFHGRLTLSSTIRADRLAELDRAGLPDDVVTSGMHRGLSTRMEITVVHAVRAPLSAPVVTSSSVKGALSRADVSIRATVGCDLRSTGRVDLEASWLDVLDPGIGPLQTTPARATLGGRTVEEAKEDESGVLVEVNHLAADTRHRTVDLFAVASSPFREYFTTAASGGPTVPLGSAPVAVHLPNRAVPPPPVIDTVLPTFVWTRNTNNIGEKVRTRSTTGLRVWLRRPWLESGDGEQLGVVIPTSTAAGANALAGNLPVADLVSRWGADPLEETAAAAAGHLAETDFGLSTTPPTGRLLTLPLHDGAAKGTQVKVVAFDVHFDAERQMWYSDIDLTIGATPWPFVRLALVRLQQQSVAGCHISAVSVADFVQLPPSRTVKFSKVGPVGVRVKVIGTPTRNSTFHLRQERRLHAPLTAATDLGSDEGVGPAQSWTETIETAAFQESARIKLDFTGSNLSTDIKKELLAGRVVIEERQNGISVIGGAPASRVVFTETIERSAIGLDI